MLPGQAERLRPLTHFVVEAAKTARKHLKQLALATPLQQLQLTELNEHTPSANWPRCWPRWTPATIWA